MPAKGDLDPSTVADPNGKRNRKTNILCEPQMDVPEGHILLSGDLEHDSIVNGPGLRAQGCRQRCPGCQNPETWTETEAGALVTIDKVKEELRALKGQAGITYCGGEPLLQAKALLEITKFCHEELGWNVWSFTGLIYEQIPRDSDAMSQRDLTLKFRGSRNQRILHLDHGKIVSEE